MVHSKRIVPVRRFRARLMTAAVASCYAAIPAVAQQLPTNPVVTSGSASFSQAGKTLNVTNSSGAVINWNSFSIGAGYTTTFNQPSASSSVLNRVVGANPSAIYGTLSSNGKVWLINPNGILIGPGGMVNTAAFVASTLSVGDADFLAGRLKFQLTPGAGGVTNQGTITTPSGGSVYLVGSNVSNEGLIATPNGETILAAGETVNLIDTGTPGVKVEITGAAGNTTNLGEILAEAGQIGMAGVIVRNSGTLNASSVVNEGGRIFLRASQDAYVEGSGRIAATGTKGGRVEVLGDRVAVMDQAQIDASGATGGGTVLVGGDYQGKNPDVRNASVTYFGPQASIKADATDSGDGGKVVVWSDGTTRAYGAISARGGANGGNGGSVEVSGRGYLDFQSTVDMRAPAGHAGTLLLDPSDIVIDNTDNYGTGIFSAGVFSGANVAPSHLSWGTIITQLGFGSLVIETNGTNGLGDITVNAPGSYNSPSALTLLANRNIIINQATGIGNNGTGDINLIAGWNNTGWAVTPGTGDITIDRSNVVAANGAVSLTAGHDITITGDTVGPATYAPFGRVIGKTVSVNAGNNISVSALGGFDQAYAGFESTDPGASSMSVTAGGSITLQSSGLTNQNDVHISSQGGLIINASTLALNAGATGHDNKAYIESWGNQTINLSYGAGTSLQLLGGGGNGSYNNFAAIVQKSTSGSQTFNLAGGIMSLQGGAGYGTGGNAFNTECTTGCSGNAGYNAAVIRNFGNGGQNINFTAGGGAIMLNGGTVGNGNFAVIRNDAGTQSVTGSNSGFYPTVMLTGGTTGGAFVSNPWGGSYLGNHATIFSLSGPQQIYATQISLDGGSVSGVGGAAIFAAAGSQTIVDSNVLSLTGGSGSNSHAAIHAVFGDQSITASRVTLQGGTAGHDNGAYISDNGNQSITVTGSGGFALEVKGGGGAGGYGNVAEIGQWGSGGSQRITLASASATTLTVAGGSGNGTGWSDYDCVSAGLSGCSMSGNHALIHNGGYNSTYGAQTINFSGSNGTLTITGGTLGSSNDARIENSTFSGPQNISGNGLAVSLTGGASGGKAMINTLYDANDIGFENSAWIESKGVQFINAGSISMLGGGTSTTFGGAGITGKSGQNITTSGNLTMQGGAGVYGSGIASSGLIATPVIIGEKSGEPIVLNVGGTLSVTGGAGPGSEAMIGSLMGAANVTINAYGGMSFSGGGSSAMVGTVIGSGGTVSLKSGYASGVYNAAAATMAFNSGTYVRTGLGVGSINLATYGTGSYITEPTGPAGSGMTTGTLNMDATNPGGYISMVGPNYASWVNASAAGNGTTGVAYHTDLSFTHVAATTTTGSIAIDSNAVNTPNGGDIGLGLVSGPGSVMVHARGAIVDDNGLGVLNVSGSAISLQSANGNNWGGIAISADVSLPSGGTLSASVPSTAAYGGIRITNVGAYEPASTSLTDASTTPGYGWVSYSTGNNVTTATAYNLSSASSGVSLYSSGTVTLTNLSTLLPSSNPAYGDIEVWGGAGMTVTNPGTTSSNLFLGTGGNMTVTGTLGANKLGLFAGGTLTATNASIAAVSGLDMWAFRGLSLVNSTATASGGDIYLGSAAFLSAGGAKGGFGTSGGDVSLDGSSVSAGTGNIYVATSGNIRLNRGSSLSAAYLDLALLGAASTLYLDDSVGQAASRINATSSIYVDFPLRSADGVVIDGVSTTTTASGSGFFVNGIAVALGSGVDIHYGVNSAAAPVNNVVNSVISTISTTTTTSPTTTTASIPPPPPPPSTTGGGLTAPGGEIGGTAGTFGGSDTSGTTTGSGATGGSNGGTASESGGDSGSNGSKEAKADSKKSAESKEGDKNEDKSHKQQRVGKCAA